MLMTDCQHVIWVFLVFHVSVTKCSNLKIKTACTGYQLMAVKCENDKMILPQQFTLGISTYKQCHDYIQQFNLRNLTMRTECCKPRPTDKLKEFCLPTETAGIKRQMYRDFISVCSGQETCSLWEKVESGDSHVYDYASMTYKCIKKTNVLFMNSSGLKSSENEVYLYNDQHGGHLNNITCVGYTKDCTSSLNISLVASKIAGTKCTIIYQDGNRASTVDCKNLVADDTCPPTFNSSSNYVIMSITMMIDARMTEREYLWLKVAGPNVGIACGSTSTSILQNISCPTSTAISSETSVTTRSMTASETRTPTASIKTTSITVSVTSTGTANTTKTHNTSQTSEETVITVVGVSVGGVIILVLIGVTFVCVKKRKRGKHTGVYGLKDSELRKKNVEKKQIVPSSSDDDDMFCENPIYATDDYKIHVRDSKKSGDTKTSDDLEPEEDPYAIMPQEQPFGIALELNRNSWVNADPPHFMMDLAVPETLANHDTLDCEDMDKNGTVGGHYSQNSSWSAKSLADVDDLYSKVIPKAERKK